MGTMFVVVCGGGEWTALLSWCAQAGVNINASESGARIMPRVTGSSSLPSFLPSFPAPFFPSFLAILGHSSLFIIYELCGKKFEFHLS